MTKLVKNNPQGTANIADDRVLATGLRCSECKHKNTVTVGNGWSKTRCRLEPHKEFYQIENDNSCGFQPCC
jgi:hypothetical protein